MDWEEIKAYLQTREDRPSRDFPILPCQQKIILRFNHTPKPITYDDLMRKNFEDKIKEMSLNGRLSEYKMLHFATHGVVVPDLPELSAVVLSQFEQKADGEDGYLRMGEIAELKLTADFVNLSACETGLGEIYAGEGVVGLTQAFLIAGANSISVSLWPINDEATSEFMVSVYSKIEDGEDYSDAISDTKREFILGEYGEEYKKPYYWAPFVYYGK